MPPLHTAEPQAGVATQATTTQSSTGTIINATVDSTQTMENDNINNTSNNNNNQLSSATTNNTISAAADSSDNQPSTPQPQSQSQSQSQLINSNNNNATETLQQQQQQQQQHNTAQNSSGPSSNNSYHNIYHTINTSSGQMSNQMYNHEIYSSTTGLPQQQQHNYHPSYLNSYEQFYQQQQQQQNTQMDFINSNSNQIYPQQSHQISRYHPYLNNPTSIINSQNSNTNNPLDANSQPTPLPAASTASSSALMSPRVVSSTSPSTSSNPMAITAGSNSSLDSPNTGTPQCKKCGIMCTNDTELQEHIANAHGASPYGSSGYASSPYIKEELQQQTPPSQQPGSAQQPNNPGELLDLDAQKMLYRPASAINANNNMMQQQNLSSIANDPLHGLHSMQQRAGLNNWDQHHTPDYMQQQPQPQLGNTPSIIKSEYTLIKSEYGGTADNAQQPSFITDNTTPSVVNQQQMPPAVPSSPAEFPSTTTGSASDNSQSGQQFRSVNFEPPSSSSSTLTAEPLSGKAANWKSNEARRPKTYNCTACNKWFTSSGHLKRHYNTTLHKNAVKSSGQPDPATLPISAHHHPSRDPSGKSSRRAAAAAAAAAANSSQVSGAQHQQQPANIVQPPEPPNSPQDYGGTTQLASHYSTSTASPTAMYQQQQQQQHQLYQHHQQQQYMQLTPSSPQTATTTTMYPQHQTQQQTVMNGHPNALAGLSAQTTQVQQQIPMPSSQMRGLLNKTLTTLTTTIPAMDTLKNEHMEAAILPEQQQQQLQEPITAAHVLELKSELGVEEEEEIEFMKLPMKQQQTTETPPPISPVIMYTLKDELVDQQEEAAFVVLREMDHNAEHHHTTSLTNQHHLYHQQPELVERLYRNNNTHSPPLIISHQQYQEQYQHQAPQQMLEPDTYTLTELDPNIMDQQQPYINMPLDTSTMRQQPNNMLQLQPLDTTIRTTHTNMVNMLAPNHHQHMQQPQQQQLTELQPLVNTRLQPINTNMRHMQQQPSLTTTITTNNITSIPSYHQLQQPASVLPPLDHTLTYPHTIIGNAEILTLDSNGHLISATQHRRQVIQTSDGQFMQFISTTEPTGGTTLYTAQTLCDSYQAQRSPQEGDLPPSMNSQNYYQESKTTLNFMNNLADLPEPAQYNSNSEIAFNNNNNNNVKIEPMSIDETSKPIRKFKSKNSTIKRQRNTSTSSSVGAPANSIILPNGRVKCIQCNKDFSKMCYLTQHNNSAHSETCFSFLTQLCEVI